jgi:hypothetical protein
MAEGFPVISTSNSENTHSRINDYMTESVFPAFHSDTLAVKMQLVCDDKSLQGKWGGGGSQGAVRYSIERYASNFDIFIWGLLAKTPRRHSRDISSRAIGRILFRIAAPVDAR